MRVTKQLLKALGALVAVVVLIAGGRQTDPPIKPFVVDRKWVPIRIDHDSAGDVLHFRNGRRLVLDLFAVEFLGQLPRSHRAPVLILGGRPCTDCDAEMTVYAIPGDANAYGFATSGSYFYPGTLGPGGGVSDTSSDYEGRMFIGQCLAERQPVVVWFEKERDSTARWKPNVYRLAVAGDSATGAFVEPMPPLPNTLRAVQTGKCLEIPGIGQTQF